MIKKLMIWLVFMSVLQSGQAEIVDPVSWSIEAKAINNNEVEVLLHAEIQKQWHLYGTDIGDNGPIPTSLHYNDSTQIAILTPFKETQPPKIKYDNNYEMNVPLIDGAGTFKQRIKIKTTTTNISGYIEYMACSGSECLPPNTSDFTINLNKGKATANFAKPAANKDAARALSGSKSSKAPFGIASETVDIGSKDTGEKAVIETAESIAKEEKTDKKDKTLLGFLIMSLLGGFLGVLTPCVYPMIPMTVAFFMRSNKSRLQSLLAAGVFGISIIIVYTSLGLIVSLTSLGADFPKLLSTHWIPNSIFFALFILFTLSFFGLFEIVLPNNLANKADQKADKGGMIGAFFMALTLVIVSFSCTGPIVGAILVEAAGGLAIKPILGMFSFGLAFALPFTILAIFPTASKKLPKSGGWLNSIKVVLGFLLLAISLKFLSNIDQNYHLGFLSRDIFIALWISIFGLLGLYLIGKIRLPHDTVQEKISVLRLFLAIIVFAFTVYLIPGLFGAQLKPISFFLPGKAPGMFDLGRTQPAENANNNATFCGNAKYSDILQLPHNLKGYFDYKEGLACAKKLNKPVLLDFKGHSCTNCKRMESVVWSDPRVLKKLRENFVIIALYVDDRTKLPENEWIVSEYDDKVKNTIGKIAADLQISKYNANTQPFYVITDTQGNALTQPIKLNLDIEAYIAFLNNGIKAFEAQN
jgi:thiol:disulfide interchange protein DsbD